MSLKEKLLSRLPKRYWNYVKDIEAEDGLIDDCKYMLYFNDGVKFCGEEMFAYPVKSISEAVRVIKEDCEYVR